MDKLNNFAIYEIEQLIKTNSDESSLGLNKNDLIEYLKLRYILVKDKNVINRSFNILKPRYVDNIIHWLTHLHIHGWTNIPIKVRNLNL